MIAISIGTPSSLTPMQRHAASLITSGKSKRQVSKTCGVSPQTMTAWTQSPAFSSLVDSLLAVVEKETQQALHGLRQRAVETLAQLMEVGPPAIRLQAARTVLEATHRPLDQGPAAQQTEQGQTETFIELLNVIEGKKTNVNPQYALN
jgi:hypothetical protein